MPKTQQGNALFLVLIAVILFAALSYAMTQSGRGGSGNISDEKISIEFARQQQILTEAASEIVRLEMKSCTSDTINPYDLQSGSPMPNDPQCAVFNVFGGRLAPQLLDKNGNQGGLAFFDARLPGIGTSSADTVAVLFFDMGEANAADGAGRPISSTNAYKVCNYINKKLGISGYLPGDGNIGDFYNDYPLLSGGGNGSEITLPAGFTGKPEGCILDEGTIKYVHYLVAIER